MRKRLAGLAAGLALTGLLAGCLNPGPPQVTVTGYVVAYNAGPGVDGSTIEVYEAGTSNLVTTTTTAGDGSYVLNLPPGSYDFVLSKPGYAGSRVENVRVAPGLKLPIIQRRAFNPNWPTDPPVVTLHNPVDGGQYEGRFGFVPYEIEVTPAAGLATDIIYAALGKTPGAGFLTGLRDIYLQTDSTGPQLLDPLEYGTFGPTTFQAVVYDTNGNRTQVFRYIEVSAPFPGSISDLQPPQIVYHMAVTLGKPIEFFRVRPQAAPEQGNLWVELSWVPQTDFSSYPNDLPRGYHVERSFDGGSTWERIATLPDDTTSYVDASPELAPGREVHYRVIAFAGSQESDPSNVVATTPLDAFAVDLLSPADGAMDVSTTPTFEWAPTQTVSDYHYYMGALWDTETGESAFFLNFPEVLVNRTQWTWNENGALDNTTMEELQRGRTYEWNLIEAYALDDPQNPHAVSIAADFFGLWFFFGSASKDHFSFTTAP